MMRDARADACVVEPPARFAGARMRGLRAIEGDALSERWLAVDGRDRAITLLRLRDEHARDPVVLRAWLARAAQSRALGSPALLPVLDHGMHAGRACVSLERADDALPLSMLLAHLAGRGESGSVELAMHVVDALTAVLNEAHRLQREGRAAPLVHGDLACERVLVRADGRVQLAELGLWCALPAALGARLRAARGAADHLPPERAAGVPADPSGDVYALGVLLRRMVGGPSSARGDTCLVVAPAARRLAVLLGKVLATDPAVRIASLDALRDTLAPLPRHAAGGAALAQLYADVRAGAADGRKATGPAARPTALFVRLGEPCSDALTRPCARVDAAMPAAPEGSARRDASLVQPPRVEPAAPRVTPVPALSPRRTALSAPDPTRSAYREPSDTVLRERTRSRASCFAVGARRASVPNQVAMVLAGALLVAALCLLSALLT